MPANDDGAATPPLAPGATDPHGQAALLLVESLIHQLLARSVISIGDAIDIVETADSVQIDLAEAADGAGASMWHSHMLLSAIAESLRHDGGDAPTPLRPVT